MEPNVELRDLQVFLVLAEELHFGRTARRLGLTQSRVSQVLSSLERKLGGQLFHRTSRRVALTALGQRLLTGVRPAYDQLGAVLDGIRADSRRLDGVLRLGLYSPAAGGPHLATIIDRFETYYPGCVVMVSDLPLADVLGPIRRGEIDVMATWLPLDRPDLTVGPILSREPRVLAVARHHALADRTEVSIEDVADYPVRPLAEVPDEIIAEFLPHRTPQGRPIRRLDREPKSIYEVAALIARGRIVHPTVPSAAELLGTSGIVYIPITDMKPSRCGLAWRRRASDPRLRAFIEVTREVLRTIRTTPPTPLGFAPTKVTRPPPPTGEADGGGK